MKHIAVMCALCAMSFLSDLILRDISAIYNNNNNNKLRCSVSTKDNLFFKRKLDDMISSLNPIQMLCQENFVQQQMKNKHIT